jgi:uncharacterized peroxidase-related enzyme
MAYISTVPVENAEGEVRDIYQGNQESWGFVPNYVKVYSNRPQVLKAWGAFYGAIRANMDPRRFELVTIAAAHALGNSYCMLAHTERLQPFYKDAELASICRDYRSAGLAPVEVAMMAYSEKVARDATTVTQADIDGLKAFGLTDPEIFDVAAAAASRAYFTKMLDGLGAEPDSAFTRMDPRLVETLVIGRQMSTEPVEKFEPAAV